MKSRGGESCGGWHLGKDLFYGKAGVDSEDSGPSVAESGRRRQEVIWVVWNDWKQ